MKWLDTNFSSAENWLPWSTVFYRLFTHKVHWTQSKPVCRLRFSTRTATLAEMATLTPAMLLFIDRSTHGCFIIILLKKKKKKIPNNQHTSGISNWFRKTKIYKNRFRIEGGGVKRKTKLCRTFFEVWVIFNTAVLNALTRYNLILSNLSRSPLVCKANSLKAISYQSDVGNP